MQAKRAGRTILVVDDEPGILDFANGLAALEGVRVVRIVAGLTQRH